MMQIGERFAVQRVVTLRGCQRVFDFAQLAVAIEHVVDGGHSDRRRLLRDVRDRP